ncbi:MAG: hypothetical protein QF754_20965, partial [Alphaproteobacteria bacterium]|nr:hypothetical protein [Alphaproteobacteria bacterium]
MSPKPEDATVPDQCERGQFMPEKFLDTGQADFERARRGCIAAIPDRVVSNEQVPKPDGRGRQSNSVGGLFPFTALASIPPSNFVTRPLVRCGPAMQRPDG